MSMATESLGTLYLCPFCSKPFRDETECRDHITESRSNGHGSVNGFQMDRPLDIRTPEAEPAPVVEWEDTLRARIGDDPDDVASVDHIALSEELDIPKPFVGYKLLDWGHQLQGGTAKITRRWSDLTDNQRDTLLAWAYYSELTHDELADRGLAGYKWQSDVSRTIRDYGWAFSEPGFEPPFTVDDWDEDAPGTVEEDAELDVASMLSASEQLCEAGDEDDNEEAEPEPEPEPVPEVEGHTPEMAEDTGAMAEEEDTAATVAVDTETAFHALVAAVEAGDIHTAHELWNTALDNK